MKITSLDPQPLPRTEEAGLGALRTERGNLPLESLDVRARLSGLVAGVEVTQGFHNPYDVTLEAAYVFPLPAGAAVTAFLMEAADRVVEGVLKERGQARADYDLALAEGRRAAVAEQERPEVFTVRVGNLRPGERVTVRLTLSQPLPYEDGAATFRFPLVVAPRYIPGAPLDGPPAGAGVSPDTDAVPDASRITPPVLLPGFPNPVRLSLAVTVEAAGLEPREIASSLHVVEREGDTLSLRPGERLDRDFVLRLSFAAATALQLDGAGTFALTVLPPEPRERERPRDVVLLLDRSGSMRGWKMVAARRAAARIVETLTGADRFAVLAFDTVVEQLFDGLREATDRERSRAADRLARLTARGGTELLEPLRQATGLLGEAAGRERVVVLVTDGQVGNEEQILARVGGALATMRVHVVGIDRAVNAGFLGRLAGLGAGRCELVESAERLDAAMERIHRRIAAPLVTDLSLTGMATEQVTGLSTLFPGVPLQVFGRYRRSAPLTLRGLAGGEPWERIVQPVTTGGSALRAQWTRARLSELEDRYAMGEHELEPEIVALSLDGGVLCRFTAYVAVDSRVSADGPPEHHVIQPVELPSGWEPPQGVAMAALAAPRPAAGQARLLHTGAPGFVREVPAPRSGSAGPGPVLEQLAVELERLVSFARPAPAYLADLGSRLAALVAPLREEGLPAAAADRLAALADDLERAEEPGADLAVLRRRTVELLTELTSADGPATARRPFWKHG